MTANAPASTAAALPQAAVLLPHEIARVARRHGLPVEDPIIVENAAGAVEHHGKPVPEFNGDLVRYWHVNPYTKCVDAALLFAGWVAEEVRERNAEQAEAQAFAA